MMWHKAGGEAFDGSRFRDVLVPERNHVTQLYVLCLFFCAPKQKFYARQNKRITEGLRVDDGKSKKRIACTVSSFPEF